MAEEFLPGKCEGYPPVSFVIFEFDARGYTPVIIDLLAAKNMFDVLIPLLAHEFHHYYRNQMLVRNNISRELKPLFWVVDQVHCEGVADLIDKRPEIVKGNPQMNAYCQMVKEAPNYLSFFDESLQKMEKDPEKIQKKGQELRENLPQSGHPVGYYMSSLILNQLGRDRIISEVNDPLQFFKTYLEAEKKAGHERTLSMDAVNIMEELLENAVTPIQAF